MPSFLRAQRVSFSFGAVELFTGLDFQLGPGWTGLTGENGAGKTTLLRLLAGELAPVAGAVRRSGECRRCPQLATSQGAGVRALAESAAFGLRARLGLDPDQLSRWRTLSPGERKRWQIAAALHGEPEVLLLDEPTNHLDAAARDWLLQALRGFRGTGVVVSHDRALLDALTSSTLRLHRGEARLHPGGYSAARAAWELDERRRGDEQSRRAGEQRRLEARLAESRRAQEAAAAQRSRSARMKSRHDSDARGIHAQARADRAEGRLGRGVAVVRRAADRAAAAVEPGQRELGGSVFAGYQRCPRPWLFRAAGRAVARHERIWIRGRNGAGKTTLLRAILAASTLPPERVLYLPQEDTPPAARALDGLDRCERGRVLSIVAALGADPDRLLASARPSPGELRKLQLALGLGRHAWVLVLDEPSNHLDLPSIERLEAALCAFPGALLLVTHDEPLARACTSATWDL